MCLLTRMYNRCMRNRFVRDPRLHYQVFVNCELKPVVWDMNEWSVREHDDGSCTVLYAHVLPVRVRFLLIVNALGFLPDVPLTHLDMQVTMFHSVAGE